MNLSSRKHILVVDDSADIQVLLKVILESNGYVVDCTSNGEEALTVLHSAEQLPDLIFLDIHMPVMDGRELQARLRGDARLSSIPVVVMTGEENMTPIDGVAPSGEVLINPLHLKSIVMVARRYSHLH